MSHMAWLDGEEPRKCFLTPAKKPGPFIAFLGGLCPHETNI